MMWAVQPLKNYGLLCPPISENRFKKKTYNNIVMTPIVELNPPFLKLEKVWTTLYPSINFLSIQEQAQLFQQLANDFNISNELTTEAIIKRLEKIKKYRNSLKKLQEMPKMEQRTEEWYAIRRNMLTASDLATAIGKGKFSSKKQLLQKKIAEIQGTNATWNSNSIPALKWGIMYEDVAMRCYRAQRSNVVCHEFGLIAHPNPSVPFGASPDGITELGIMVELKCPWKRKIEHGTVPEQYYYQIQGQLEVCDLDECDYVECILSEVQLEEYLNSNPGNNQHGAVLEWINEKTKEVSYEYSSSTLTNPKDVMEWAESTAEHRMNEDDFLQITTIHYWLLKDLHIIRVYRDRELWKTIELQIQEFWNEVKAGRTEPMLKEDIKTHSYKKQKVIFREEDNESGV